MTIELITLIANIALTLSFIAALVFGIAQVRATARDRRERLTLDAIRSFQTREFAEMMLYVSSRKIPVTREEMAGMPINEQVILLQFSQQMEHLGMMVSDKLIDLDLVEKTLGTLVTTSWDKCKTMFMEIRENAPDPFLGEYFQWLAEEIEKRMRENPRQPFYLNTHPSCKK